MATVTAPTFKDRLLRLLPVVLVVGGVGAFAAAGLFGSAGGPGAADTNDAIEELIPAEGSEVLKQTQVGIDLAAGYQAVLYLNDIRIPETEVNVLRDPDDPGNSAPEGGDFATALARYVFQPLPGRTVEELRPDRNCARAEFWPVADPTDISNVEWCFTAA